MKVKTNASKKTVKVNAPIKATPETCASGRWTAIQHIRPSRMMYLPLSSDTSGG